MVDLAHLKNLETAQERAVYLLQFPLTAEIVMDDENIVPVLAPMFKSISGESIQVMKGSDQSEEEVIAQATAYLKKMANLEVH